MAQFMTMARGRLGRETIGTLILRIGALALALGVTVSFARLMGPEKFGAYALAFAWIQILIVPATLGMDTLMLREVARLKETEPSRIRAYVSWSNKAVAVGTVLTGLVGGGIVVAVHSAQNPDAVLPQLVALVLLPLMTIAVVWQAVLRGLGRIFLGQIPNALVVPLITLALAGLVWGSTIDLSPAQAIGLRIVSVAVVVGLLGFLLVRVLPAGGSEGLASAETRGLLRSTFALAFIGAVFLLVTRTDVVMLGILSDLESVGNYTVAARGASFVLFPFAGLHIVLAPTLASLYATDDRSRMQAVLTWGSRAAFAGAIPIAAGLFWLGELYLDWFGEGFAGGLDPLRILVVGSMVASLAGFVSLVMMMTGQEYVAAKMGLGVAFMNILLNLALIPPLGAEGAAIATAASTIVGNGILVVWVWRRMGLDGTIVGLRRARPTA